ncbi:hypothetical protein [Hydrocarboniclastica marina]|uniref:Uncharacterized protein n=1 Tax=Hydrocarboniclastica marina TaxID=2259620 RepID=A0A4V1D8A6_9ALTE|nr:hypothetical protein [Hydrocarboniclastica marina]MAL97961.1 hypothetical protein [Alteromonadaceae bacterium]QCF24520.1 hypothetical protein soil367_00300 [Hydrocarboniclastica marina]|tara:strand:- start:997 stop:1884 length:888 start_codon:yes stop_codon:yes gene_type:complete
MGRKVVVLAAVGALAGATAAGVGAWYLLQSSTLVLESDRIARIAVAEEIEANVSFAEAASIQFAEEFSVGASIDSEVEVPIESTFSVPLDFELTFPVSTTMRVDQDFAVSMDVPLRFELTQDDVQLGRMLIDVDTEVSINDEVEIEMEVPVDATLAAFGFMPVPVSGTIPVRTRMPINQPIRIKDQIEVNVADFGMVVDTVVPLTMQVPIHQDVTVKGEVTGRVRKTIQVPISERLRVPIKQTVPVSLHLAEGVKIRMDDFIPTRIRFDQPLPVQVQSLEIAPGDLRLMQDGARE